MNERTANVIQIEARTGSRNVKVDGTPTNAVTTLDKPGAAYANPSRRPVITSTMPNVISSIVRIVMPVGRSRMANIILRPRKHTVRTG